MIPAKLRVLVWLLLIILMVGQANATEKPILDRRSDILTHDQLMMVAYSKGAEIGFPETIQGILQQETRAGRFGRIGNKNATVRYKSYGVMQIQPDTAIFILKKLWKWTDEEVPPLGELIIQLVTDDIFNIELGTSYFEYLVNYYGGPDAYLAWSKAVLAYNVGPGRFQDFGFSFDPNNYIKGVQSKIIKLVRPFNLKYNLKHASMVE